MSSAPPSTAAALSAIARLALLRATRGALPAVAFVIACLPAAAAGALSKSAPIDETMSIVQLLLAVLPALFVAPAIGEEIENRTATYLWSRPLARWTILAGKLLALVPLCVVFLVGSWLADGAVNHALLAPQPIVAVAAGTVATAVVVAGIATVLPRHGMAFAIVYLLIDLMLGALPASVRLVSVSFATRSVAGLTDAGPTTGAIGLAVIGALWLAIALRRIARLET